MPLRCWHHSRLFETISSSVSFQLQGEAALTDRAGLQSPDQCMKIVVQRGTGCVARRIIAMNSPCNVIFFLFFVLSSESISKDDVNWFFKGVQQSRD